MPVYVDPGFVVANWQTVTPERNALQAAQESFNAAMQRVIEHGREPAQVTVTIHVKPKDENA